MVNDDHDGYLTFNEACAYLARSKRCMYRDVAERNIRFARFGNLLRFKKQWLDDFAREREQAPLYSNTAIARAKKKSARSKVAA